jgi:hypothetical protein
MFSRACPGYLDAADGSFSLRSLRHAVTFAIAGIRGIHTSLLDDILDAVDNHKHDETNTQK